MTDNERLDSIEERLYRLEVKLDKILYFLSRQECIVVRADGKDVMVPKWDHQVYHDMMSENNNTGETKCTSESHCQAST